MLKKILLFTLPYLPRLKKNESYESSSFIKILIIFLRVLRPFATHIYNFETLKLKKKFYANSQKKIKIK